MVKDRKTRAFVFEVLMRCLITATILALVVFIVETGMNTGNVFIISFCLVLLWAMLDIYSMIKKWSLIDLNS